LTTPTECEAGCRSLFDLLDDSLTKDRVVIRRDRATCRAALVHALDGFSD